MGSRRAQNSTPLPEEDLLALQRRRDETKDKIAQLERLLEEKARLDASTMTREEIDARIEQDEQNLAHGPSWDDQKYLREQDAIRWSLGLWQKHERPRVVAELQRLQEERRQLDKRFGQAVQRKRQPSKWTKDSSKRVADVQTIISQLSAFRASTSDGVEKEDLEVLKRANPHWLLWKAIRGSPQLREKVLSVRSRRWLVGLAQELVARLHGVAKTTVERDWTHRPKTASSTASK